MWNVVVVVVVLLLMSSSLCDDNESSIGPALRRTRSPPVYVGSTVTWWRQLGLFCASRDQLAATDQLLSPAKVNWRLSIGWRSWSCRRRRRRLLPQQTLASLQLTPRARAAFQMGFWWTVVMGSERAAETAGWHVSCPSSTCRHWTASEVGARAGPDGPSVSPLLCLRIGYLALCRGTSRTTDRPAHCLSSASNSAAW